MPAQSAPIAGADGGVASPTPTLIPTGACGDQPAVPLDRPTLLIGARDGCDLQLAFSSLAEVHALIVSAAEGVYIRNLTEPDAVQINGLPVREQLLADGDQLQMSEFTCRFAANQSPQLTPEPLPPWAFEANGQPIPPVRGRTALIGTAPLCDLQITGQGVSPCHAVLLAADGKWKIADTASDSGTFVNGKSVRCAALESGDVLRIGFCQVRVLAPPQPAHAAPAPSATTSPPATASPPAPTAPVAPSYPAIHEGDSYIGGMPVTLPEVGPPQNFGRVAISFGDKSLRSAPPPPTPVGEPAPEAKRDEFVAVNTGHPAVADVPESPEKSELPAIAPASHAFPVVPPRRIIHRKQALRGFDEPAPDELGEQPMQINDAPFGGAPLGSADNAFDADSAAMAESFGPEGESFADNEFWDQTDSDANLPKRPSDLTPHIPSGNGDSHRPPAGGNGDSAPEARPPALVPLPLPLIPRAAYPTLPTTRRGAFRPKATVVLVSLMTACLIAVTTAICVFVPTHSVLEGRLTFTNAPAQGTREWHDFEADQRRRLADPNLSKAAIASLKDDHSHTDAGFLGNDPAALASLVSSARFEPDAIVLGFRGVDAIADRQRLTALLKAQYNSDADLVAAVGDATKALDKWEPLVALRKQELDTLSRRIDQVAKVVASGAGQTEKVPPLYAAGVKAAQDYTAIELAVEADQAKLDELNQSLAGGGSEYSASAATQPSRQAAAAPATRPSTAPALAVVPAPHPATKDAELADLYLQIDETAAQIAAIKNAIAGAAPETGAQSRADAQKKLDAAMAAADSILNSHSDLRITFASDTQMQSHINLSLDQLAQGRKEEDRWVSLRQWIEQTGRRRQRIIDESDATSRQLRADLILAQREAAAYDERRFAAPDTRPAILPTTAPTTAPAEVDPHIKLDQIEQSLMARQVRLVVDDTAPLRERVSRLTDDADYQLRSQRQVIIDTLGTLKAGLDAIDVPSGLTADQKAALSGLTQAVRDLLQSQADAAAAIGRADSGGGDVAALEAQLTELKTRAEYRRRIVTAPPAGDETHKQALTAKRDATAAQLAQDRAAMDAARLRFNDQTMAVAQTALTVATARKAQDDLTGLTAARDVKLGDLSAMQHSREDLAQRLKTTVNINRPSESDVKVISDDSMKKLIYVIAADALIGVIFTGLILALRKTPAAAAV